MNALQFKLALGRATLPRRLPRQSEPLAIERAYARRVRERVLAEAMALLRERLVPHLEAMAAAASRVATTDAADDLGDIMEGISKEYFERWTRQRFLDVVRSIGTETAKFQTTQLNRQMKAAIGVDVVGNEPWLQASIDEWARENASLIKDVPTQLYADVEKFVSRELADGARWEELAATIEDRYGIAERRANLIARDQVGKFNGDLNRVRQTDLGVIRFIWRTMGDERVRTDETAGDNEGHQERNGQSYEWSDPPEGETPGEPIMCRCYAEPDLKSALAEESD